MDELTDLVQKTLASDKFFKVQEEKSNEYNIHHHMHPGPCDS